MSSPTKILFVSHASGLCGSERALIDLIEGLDKSRYESRVLVPSDGALVAYFKNIGIKTMIFPYRLWTPFRADHGLRHFAKFILKLPKNVAFIRNLIRTEKINIVYTN